MAAPARSAAPPQARIRVADSIEAKLDDPSAPLLTARSLTHGPKFHWFGYYDKAQTDPSGRFVLGMAADFEHRSPTEDDEIEIGWVDTQDGDRWVTLGSSRAFGWQQGCMLQWRPGSADEVLWNDRRREGEAEPEGAGAPRREFVTRIFDRRTGETRTLPLPTYTVSPDGNTALSVDFARIQALRPGYGYAGPSRSPRDERAPTDDGIWRMDLRTGDCELLLSIADVASRPVPEADDAHDLHYFNHLQWAPDGQRFFFLHRWRSTGFTGFRTRALTAAGANPDVDRAVDRWEREDVRVLSEAPGISHFEWRDAQHVVLWREGAYRLLRDDGRGEETVLWRAPNGHVSHLREGPIGGPLRADGDWLVTDTYPRGPQRLQTLHLVQLSTGRVVVLGRYASPSPYQGEWRCDLHPRLDGPGRRVLFDSPHGGEGRQLWALDLPPLAEPAAPLPRVLLLGDSISIGYTPFVQVMLEGEAVVVRPMQANGRPENCAGTTYGREHVRRWLELDGGDFDVVHFNFGLHDLKRVQPGSGANSDDPADPRQAEPDRYAAQLREIVAVLRASGARLVLGTTTPVPEGGVRPHRDAADVLRYNALARTIAAEAGIPLDDLHAAVLPRLAELQESQNVHFTSEGSHVLAEQVVRSIRAELAALRGDSR